MSSFDSIINAVSKLSEALKIPEDKLLHVCLGTIWLINCYVAFLVLVWFGLGPMLAYGTTTYAILYEVNQKIRKEGVPSFWDAVATSLPGWVAWGLIALFPAVKGFLV